MMASFNSLLHELCKKNVWQEFIEEGVLERHFCKQEEKELKAFVDSEEYLLASKKLISNLNIDYPTKHFINKMNSDKKRIIYAFYGPDKALLKVLVWLMNKYDYLFQYMN